MRYIERKVDLGRRLKGSAVLVVLYTEQSAGHERQSAATTEPVADIPPHTDIARNLIA